MRTFAAVLIMVLLAAAPAAAQVKGKPKPSPPGVHMSVFAGGISFDSDQDLGTGPTFGVKLGYDLHGQKMTENIGFEGIVGGVSASGSGGGDDASGYFARVESIFPMYMGKGWIPYLAFGLGYINLDRDGATEDGAIFGYGGGLKYHLREDIQARFDLRHLLWFEADRLDNLEYTAGLSYLFGVERKPKPVPPPDADKDGVADAQDKCPDTPAGMVVDRTGCPTDRTDSDGDGVYDWQDRCPATTKDAKVGKDGCPLDSDGDKVPDHLDLCPDTPVGVTVDATGCVGS